jgi:succinate dehydrogenase/fumarate reductase flavoprotein subunit
VAATILGDHIALSDDTLDAVARRDLARMSPLQPNDRRVRVIGTDMQRVAIMRIPFAQYAQPVETEMTVSHARASGDAPANTHEHARTPLPGLFRASEVLHSSSLEGAARGGQMAARACTS